MDIINDFAVLAIAIAVTYPTFRFWRYLTSRATSADEAPSTLEKQIEALEESVRRINESKNIWTRLSQSEVALISARTIGELLPSEPDVQDQINHLKNVQTGLANAALRAKVDQLWKRLPADVEVEHRVKYGQELLRFLREEGRKQIADIRLIDHYHASLKWYLEKLQQTKSRKKIPNGGSRESFDTLERAYHASLTHLLDKELPDTVRFFDGAQFKLERLAGSSSG